MRHREATRAARLATRALRLCRGVAEALSAPRRRARLLGTSPAPRCRTCLQPPPSPLRLWVASAAPVLASVPPPSLVQRQSGPYLASRGGETASRLRLSPHARARARARTPLRPSSACLPRSAATPPASPLPRSALQG